MYFTTDDLFETYGYKYRKHRNDDLFETYGYKHRNDDDSRNCNHKRKVLSEAKRKKIIELIDKHTREIDDILASRKNKGRV